MADVPCHLPDVVRSFIMYGWTVDKAERPSAAKLLEHSAFCLLGRCFVLLPITLLAT